MENGDSELESGSPATSPPPIGLVAEGLHDVVRAATESDDTFALVEATFDAILESLRFDRATYLEYSAGVVRLPEWKRGADPAVEIALEEHPELHRAARAARATVVSLGADSPVSEALEAMHPDIRQARPLVLVPVSRGEELAGILLLGRHSDRHGPEVDARTLEVSTVFGALLGLGMSALIRTRRLEHLREVLEERTAILSADVSADADACKALEGAVSRSMRRLVHSAKQVAVTDAPVLITGETGSGKEVLARAIHEWSQRASGPFVQLNCAALSDHLIESELFGHVKGAFSGAVAARAGRFRVADGGTLLLDEIGEMSLDAQTKLLRVLEMGEVLPVGADRTVKVDVRVIAATNVDLDMAIDRGEFREDLYFRLDVFPMHLPPLRERAMDIPGLVDRLLERMRQRTGHGPWRITESDMDELVKYSWPGNVRELVNVLERGRVFSPLGGTLGIRLGEESNTRSRRRKARRWPTMDDHQRLYLQEVLRHTGGKIYGDGGAAALLGLPPSTLQSRMRRLGVERPEA